MYCFLRANIAIDAGMAEMACPSKTEYSRSIIVLYRTGTSYKPKYHLLMVNSSMGNTRSMKELIQSSIVERTTTHSSSFSPNLSHIVQMMILIGSLSTFPNKSMFLKIPGLY